MIKIKQNSIPDFLQENCVFKDSGIFLYKIDCVQFMDIMIEKYPEGVFDMIFADPPYFLSNGGITCHAGKITKVDKGKWDKSKGVNENHEFNLSWLSRCQKLLKTNGTIWASGTHHVIYRKYKHPLLMQPIWKTVGKSAKLADNCLDIFVWSDFALTRLFMDSALENDSGKISRQQRAAARLARFLFEVSRTGKVYQEPIYDGMSLGNQTDKEFAISGNKTHKYMSCDRLTRPIINKNQIKKIILGGGQKWLSPERRFDAIIYFSTDLFD